MKLIHYFFIASTLLLTGCSMFSPVPTDNQANYMINTLPTNIPKRKPRAISLMVLPPTTKQIYDTKQMAYTNKRFQVSYFVLNSWAETPSDMLQSLLVQTLQNTHYFHSVSTTPYVGLSSYVLTTQIAELIQDFTQTPHMMRVSIHAQLLQSSTNRVVAAKDFTINEPIEANTPYAGVIAANDAVEEILVDISRFCVNNA